MGAGPIKSIGLQILQHILLKLVIDIHKRVFSLKVPTIYLKFVILAFAIYVRICVHLDLRQLSSNVVLPIHTYFTLAVPQ